MNESSETLAAKHKARRMAGHRLLDLTNVNPADAGATLGETMQEETLPVETMQEETPPVGATPEEIPPDAAPQITLLQYVRTTSRQGWQGVRRLPGRFTGWAQDFRQRRAARREEDRGSRQPPPGGEPPRRLRRAWTAMRPFLWRGRVGPAFWTVASSLSLVVNIILIVILILLGRQLFFLKKTVVSDKLIGGLYNNFILMDQAHIQTTITVSDTIQVKDTIPVVFDLPLNQKTVVILTKDTPVKNATIFLNNTAVPLDLILREGTELSIQLDMTVPVQQSIPVVLNVPVNLQVPVDIPLDQTQLHQPFVGLHQVVAPYRQLLGDLPFSWGAVCKGPFKLACSVLRFK